MTNSEEEDLGHSHSELRDILSLLDLYTERTTRTIDQFERTLRYVRTGVFTIVAACLMSFWLFSSNGYDTSPSFEKVLGIPDKFGLVARTVLLASICSGIIVFFTSNFERLKNILSRLRMAAYALDELTTSATSINEEQRAELGKASTFLFRIRIQEARATLEDAIAIIRKGRSGITHVFAIPIPSRLRHRESLGIFEG